MYGHLPGFGSHPTVEGRLAAARLPGWEFHPDPRPFEDAHNGFAGLGINGIQDACDK